MLRLWPGISIGLRPKFDLPSLYSEAFPEEINEAIADNDSTDFERLKRMLPRAVDFVARKASGADLLKLLRMNIFPQW